MQVPRRGQPGWIALGGALGWALAWAGSVPAGAQTATGPNVVAHPYSPPARVNKITTLINAISTMSGRDKTREKYIDEIVSVTAHAAADGHTSANADHWQALGAERRNFLLRRQQEARGGTEPDKKRFEQDKALWCRLQMLEAAAHIVDGGDRNILQAVNILEQVLAEAGEIKDAVDRGDIEDRVKALGSAALMLKPGPPPAAGVAKRFSVAKDRAGLRDLVAGLYAETDPPAGGAVVARTRQAIQELAPARPPAPARKPNRYRQEAEGIVAGAVDTFLESVTLIKDYDVLLGEQLARAEESASRYRIPPALEAAYQAAIAGKHRQLEIHEAFRQWTEDPHGQEERTARALKSIPPEQFPTLRYYQAVFDAWRTDKLYRRDNLDESQHSYAQLLEVYRAELNRARRETPGVVAAGTSRLEQYAKALLDLYGKGSRPEGMRVLGGSAWDAGSPLQRGLQRAVEYHLLRHSATGATGVTGTAQAWQQRLADATGLCQRLQQDGQAPDAECLGAYQKLQKQIQEELDKLMQTAAARQLEQVRQMIQAGQTAEALLLVFRSAVRGETVGDADRRLEMYRLGGMLLSCPLSAAQRQEADALVDELCVWDEFYRIGADSEGARRQGALAIRAVLAGAAAARQPDQHRYARIRRVAEEMNPPGRWDPRVGPLARRIWLEGLIDAEEYDGAHAFLAARASWLDLRKLAGDQRELPDRITRLIGHYIESPRTAADLATSLPRARSLLDRPDLPLAATVSDPLRRRLGERYQALHAADVITAPPGGAFAALRARAGDVPAGASPDAEGQVLWERALTRLVAEADSAADFRDLADLRTVGVPHEPLARRAMDKAVDAAASGAARRAGELAEAAAVLLAPVGGQVHQASYWFDRYMSLAGNPGFTAPQQCRWKTEAGKYLPREGGSAWDLYRQATLAYEVGDLKRCRQTVEAMPRPTADLLVLGAACCWREGWVSARDLGELSQSVAQWWRQHTAGDPYEALIGLEHLRAGTSARRQMLAALVYLGHPAPDVRQLRALADACADAARVVRAGAEPVGSRPFDRLVWDEPVLAGYVHGLLQIRLADRQTGVLRRTGMAAAAQRFLPEESASNWPALPAAVQEAVADAAYEGHCWTRASAVYGMQMRSLREQAAASPARALAPAEVEACRRWLECEVYRRAGRDVGLANLVRHLRASAGELAWTEGRVFAGLVGEARRSAAARIWSGSDGPTGAIDALYGQMVRKTANKCLGRGDLRLDNTQWGPLRSDPAINPYASLWCFVSIWPHSSSYPKQWAHAGAGWPRGLQDWVEESERQPAASAARQFEQALEQWGREAGPAGRDRRAEAHLIRHLLYKDVGSLADAVRTFAFGNPEYSLAVRLAEEK